jgi:hypothetical protein
MRASVICVLLVGIGGCGRGDEVMTEQEFCQEYARRECAKVGVHCVSANPGACETMRTAACREFADRSRSNARMYNPANTGPCLRKVTDVYGMSLISAQELDEVCSRVFQGMARANEACTVDYDCEKDLICDKGRCGTRKVVAASAGCANIGEVCPMGQYCGLVMGVHSCVTRQDKGRPCSTSEPCKEAFRCAGTCVDRLPIGMACTSHDECASGFCNPYVERICAPGLSFGLGSHACKAYTGELPDGGM